MAQKWKNFVNFFGYIVLKFGTNYRCSPHNQFGVTTTLQPFNGLFSRTTWVSRYQKGKTNLDFTEARDSEWQWHQLSHMQVCTSLQTDNHASTPPLCFLQARCPSCHPTNSVKALKAQLGVRLIKYFPQICQWFSLASVFKWLACAVNDYIFHYWQWIYD